MALVSGYQVSVVERKNGVSGFEKQWKAGYYEQA